MSNNKSLAGLEIALDLNTAEADQYISWLQSRGATAYVSNTTETTINGIANRELSQLLWTSYCNGTEPTLTNLLEVLLMDA